MGTTTPKWKHGVAINFTKPKRDIHTIFLHCSASDRLVDDDQSIIKSWHLKRGFSDIGYHFFINKNGNIQEGRSLESSPAAQKNHNKGTIAICCHGLKASKFTDAQMESVKSLCKAITDQYKNGLRIRGHKEVSAKSCPVFDYKSVLNLDNNGYYKNTTPTAIKPQKTAYTETKIAEPGKCFQRLDQGYHILALQKILSKLGHPCMHDGIFGINTYNSVVAFQKKRRLKPDGLVGRRTLGGFFNTQNTLKMSDRGFDVEVLQLVLLFYGYKLIVDGVFGKGTHNKLISLQRIKRLKPDGVFGAFTKKKLTFSCS